MLPSYRSSRVGLWACPEGHLSCACTGLLVLRFARHGNEDVMGCTVFLENEKSSIVYNSCLSFCMCLSGGQLSRGGARAMAKAAVNLLETQINTVRCCSCDLTVEILSCRMVPFALINIDDFESQTLGTSL